MQQEGSSRLTSSPRLTLAFLQIMVLAAVAYLAVVVLVAPPLQRETAASTGTFQEVAGVSQAWADPAAAIGGQTLQRSLDDTLYNEIFTTPTPVVPRATRTLDVRLGPAEGYAVLGLVPPDGRLDVVGRNERGDWLAIVFTPGASFHGWIPAASTTGIGDIAKLPVVPLSPLRTR